MSNRGRARVQRPFNKCTRSGRRLASSNVILADPIRSNTQYRLCSCFSRSIHPSMNDEATHYFRIYQSCTNCGFSVSNAFQLRLSQQRNFSSMELRGFKFCHEFPLIVLFEMSFRAVTECTNLWFYVEAALRFFCQLINDRTYYDLSSDYPNAYLQEKEKIIIISMKIEIQYDWTNEKSRHDWAQRDFHNKINFGMKRCENE